MALFDGAQNAKSYRLLLIIYRYFYMVNEEGESQKSKFMGLNSDSTKLAVALATHELGFKILPLIPNSKKPATKWGRWEGDVDERQIRDYWNTYPNHDVGILTNNQLYVLDADTPEAHEVLCQLEVEYDCKSNFVVKTSKGFHHYYKYSDSTHVKQYSHSTEKYPERLDVKTGRSLVVAPFIGGRELVLCEVDYV